MKTGTVLVLVRHGCSTINDLMRGGPFSATNEIAEQVRQIPNHVSPLTQLGETQADEVGAVLEQRFGRFDTIIHSGYARARQTAERIATRLGHNQPLFVDSSFRERDGGYAYGMTKKEFLGNFPWLKGYWEREGWFLARPVGGESISDVLYNRISPALRELLTDHAGQRILVVSHGRAIQAARLFLEHHPTNQPHCPVKLLPNCGYVAYRRANDKMILIQEHP